MDLSNIDLYKKFDEDIELLQETPGDAELFYTKYMEQVLNKKIQEVLIELGTKTNSTEELMFWRGTLNGLMIIRDWFLEQKAIVMSRYNVEEK